MPVEIIKAAPKLTTMRRLGLIRASLRGSRGIGAGSAAYQYMVGLFETKCFDWMLAEATA